MRRLPKAGQLLYRGRSCDDFAKILRVGQDPNGRDIMDVELLVALDEIYFPSYQHPRPEEKGLVNLATIELPEGTKVVIRDVPWRWPDPSGKDPKAETRGDICLAISTGGCYRCTEHFYPHEPDADPFGDEVKS